MRVGLSQSAILLSRLEADRNADDVIFYVRCRIEKRDGWGYDSICFLLMVFRFHHQVRLERIFHADGIIPAVFEVGNIARNREVGELGLDMDAKFIIQ